MTEEPEMAGPSEPQPSGLAVDEEADVAQTLALLPAETLAYRLLTKLPAGDAVATGFDRTTLVRRLAPDGPVDERAVAAALQVLVTDGVLVAWPPAADMLTLTSWGERVKAAGERGLALSTARRRIGLELHRDLRDKLRDLIAVGAFEYAALIALRAVEARVRGLARDPRNQKGARLTAGPLMKHAFGVDGPLADPNADPGEQVGLMDLFSGAFGAIRNLLAHTEEVEWSDSIEAAEYVLLGDLLMRRLDRIEDRFRRVADEERSAIEKRSAAAAANRAQLVAWLKKWLGGQSPNRSAAPRAGEITYGYDIAKAIEMRPPSTEGDSATGDPSTP